MDKNSLPALWPVHAWCSLRDLYEDGGARELRATVFQDESAATLAYAIFEPIVGEEVESIPVLATELFDRLEQLLDQTVSPLSKAKRVELFVKGVKSLIRNDAELRMSFTLKECVSFAQGAEAHEETLSTLDRFSGLFLALSVLEKALPNFNVTRRLSKEVGLDEETAKILAKS